jgi:hypothetical protein
MLRPNRSLSTDVGRSAARGDQGGVAGEAGLDSEVLEAFGDDRGVDVAVS